MSPTEAPKKFVKFIYSLPAEVLRTSYQRHQRGTMDSKIYLLLTKKEILLPQVYINLLQEEHQLLYDI